MIRARHGFAFKSLLFLVGIIAASGKSHGSDKGVQTADYADSADMNQGATGQSVKSAKSAVAKKTGIASRVKHYFRSRMLDAAEVPMMGIGFGGGLHADVEATILAHVGVGAAYNHMLGMHTFKGLLYGPRWNEIVGGIPFNDCFDPLLTHARGVRAGPLIRGEKLDHSHTCSLVPLLLSRDMEDLPNYRPAFCHNLFPPIGWADVSAGATVFPVAVRVGFSPGEALDFLGGWVGIDIAGDDDRQRIPFASELERGSYE